MAMADARGSADIIYRMWHIIATLRVGHG